MPFARRLALAALLLAGPALAADRPTPEEARAVTLKAAALIAASGIDAARPALHAAGEYRYGEIYVNVIDGDGRWLVYPPRPAGEGQVVINLKDADGKLLVQDIVRTAREHGEGWVEYRWANPTTNRIEPKLSFVKNVPGANAIVYVGVYR